MKKFSFFLAFALIIAASQSCGNDKPTTPPPPPVTTKKLPIPKFDRSLAYDFVAKQVEFGPRVPNTEAHKATKAWLSSQLKEHGATVIEQDFVLFMHGSKCLLTLRSVCVVG